MAFETPGQKLPRPPRSQPVWTWLWTAFAILALVLTVLGIYYAGTPR
jgi:hypothetical protein